MDLYKRSIYFEIVSLNTLGEPQALLESFAFTIPPQNINISTPQRVTVTQTPGGNFVDNYGLGNAQISINGETGNEESRLTILGPGKTPRQLTGQEAYFEFRDRIERYSLNNDNYSMRFYDLTHKGSVSPFSRALDSGLRGGYSEAWEVVLKNSGSNRSYSKPFWYPYSIELEGIRPLGAYNARFASNRVGFLSDIRGYIESASAAISSFVSSLELFLAENYQYVEDVVDIVESVDTFLLQINSFGELVIEYEQKLAGLFDEVLSVSENALTTGVEIISFPYAALETAKGSFNDIEDKANLLTQSARNAGLGLADKYNWDEDSDKVSDIELSLEEAQEPMYAMVLISKQNSSFEPVSATVLNGEVTPIYGYSSEPIKSNTRLEVLARDVYGDPGKKELISTVNEVYADEDLVSGETLTLPLLTPQTRYTNIAVYNTPETRDDILGKDAKVNNNGVFVLSSSDYITTNKEETVYQSVWFRLSEQRGRQVRDNSYGVLSNVGEALSGDAPLEIISLSVKETLSQDPRIQEVYDLNFLVNEDQIYQVFKMDLITKNTLEYKEGL